LIYEAFRADFSLGKKLLELLNEVKHDKALSDEALLKIEGMVDTIKGGTGFSNEAEKLRKPSEVKDILMKAIEEILSYSLGTNIDFETFAQGEYTKMKLQELANEMITNAIKDSIKYEFDVKIAESKKEVSRTSNTLKKKIVCLFKNLKNKQITE